MSETRPPKVVLITGCSSGFGLLTAARLSASGHCVFATMRNLNKKGELLNEVKRRGGSVELLQLDVTDIPSIQKAVRTIKEKRDRKSTRLNSSHSQISYAVFC